MSRKARYMRGNKGTEGPSDCIFFNTESIRTPVPGMVSKNRLTLRCWSAIYVRLEGDQVTRRKVAHGTSASEFWQTVKGWSRDHTSCYLYANSIGDHCTHLLLWEELDAERLTIRPVVRDVRNRKGDYQQSAAGKLILDGPPTYIVCRDGWKTFKFVDTGNYWRTSLCDLGKNLGHALGKHPNEADPDEDWREYCHRGCQVVESAMLALLGRWIREDCGVFQITAASLAMTNFRHTCNVRTDDGECIDIVCDPNSPPHTLERESYYGGRTICFFVGTVRGSIYHLDCNSLYPSVMAANLYPRRFVRYQKGMTHDELQSSMRVYGVVARVLIKSRHHTFPVRLDGKQYHCTGEYWTSLCGPELQRAIDTESVHRIGTVQLYSVAPLFTKWVSYWYDRKVAAVREGHRGLAELEFVKLVLCSLSGKWAQRGRNWIDRPDVIPRQRWGGWTDVDTETRVYTKWRAVAGNAQILSDESEPAHAFPAISAFITSHAREYMRTVIDACPPQSVYYMATDSLVCDERAFTAIRLLGLVDQTALGKFKLLGKYAECEIFGPNHYRLDDKEISSGLLGAYIGAKGKTGTVEVRERLPSIIADGPRSDTILTTVPVGPVKPDHRGHINPAGWWEPYRLTTDPDFGDRPVSASDLPAYLLDTRGDRTPVIS